MQDSQGEKVVKSRWWLRNDCDIAKKNLITVQVNFVLIPSEAGMRQHKLT